jgi:cytochrome c oxidase subunit 3
MSGSLAMPGRAPDSGLARAGDTALWAFIAVATSLFALFITAYAMRMDAPDWSPLAMPSQLWFSSALLLAGSVTLHRAGTVARSGDWARARRALAVGGILAIGFLLVQAWAWQLLLAQRVVLAGNPAASFFYLLTALHALHVIGGLFAWAATVLLARSPQADPARVALRIALCARYWHFLFAVWIVLFAALGWLTPEIVRYLCGQG